MRLKQSKERNLSTVALGDGCCVVACVVAQKGLEAVGAEVVGSWDLSLGLGLLQREQG